MSSSSSQVTTRLERFKENVELAGELRTLGGGRLVEARHDRLPVDPFAIAAAQHGQGRELVAAQASDHVGVAERQAQHVGRGQHEGVAGRVAELVVDLVQAARARRAARAPGRPDGAPAGGPRRP